MRSKIRNRGGENSFRSSKKRPGAVRTGIGTRHRRI